MVFKVFQKLFTILYNFNFFYFLLTEVKPFSEFPSVIGRCSLVPTSHWLQGKCARNDLSQAASGIILQNHRRLPVSISVSKIAAFWSLKRVTGNISNLVNNFKEQAKTVEFDFFIN